jgi:transposase-like protein
MANRGRYSQELRERAVRLVAEQENQHGSQWEPITSVAEKIGCSAGTLRRWRRQAERDAGARNVWRQLPREGFAVAGRTVERLMRTIGLQSAVHGT